MHLRDEIVHVGQRRVIRLDDDLEPRVERTQLEVGDDNGDLDEFVHRKIESRHLAVDPDKSIIFGRSYHALQSTEGMDIARITVA
jgi:hypothetical protein